MDKKKMDRVGYDSEEAYFSRLNSQLAGAQNREELGMICPRCGSSMKELEVKGIRLDQCSSCQGIYFDSGELDLFVHDEDPERIEALKQRIH